MLTFLPTGYMLRFCKRLYKMSDQEEIAESPEQVQPNEPEVEEPIPSEPAPKIPKRDTPKGRADTAPRTRTTNVDIIEDRIDSVARRAEARPCSRQIGVWPSLQNHTT